jgi:hypothetical protein
MGHPLSLALLVCMVIVIVFARPVLLRHLKTNDR